MHRRAPWIGRVGGERGGATGRPSRSAHAQPGGSDRRGRAVLHDHCFAHGLAVQARRDASRQLREPHDSVGADVEDAVVRLERGVGQGDGAARRATDDVASGAQDDDGARSRAGLGDHHHQRRLRLDSLALRPRGQPAASPDTGATDRLVPADGAAVEIEPRRRVEAEGVCQIADAIVERARHDRDPPTSRADEVERGHRSTSHAPRGCPRTVKRETGARIAR